jgi:cytochrome b561
MQCCLVILALLFPRFVLIVMALAGHLSTAYETYIWPLLGFFIMPYTTCAYAIAMNEAGGVKGWGLVIVIVAVLLDIGGHGGAANSRRRYQRVG